MNSWWNRLSSFLRKRQEPRFKIVADSTVFSLHKGVQTLWTVRWEQIEIIEAYKVDLFTVDQLRLAFYSEDERVHIIEEDIGDFEDFVAQMMAALPSIPTDWRTKVLFPAFEESRMVIYNKNP